VGIRPTQLAAVPGGGFVLVDATELGGASGTALDQRGPRLRAVSAAGSISTLAGGGLPRELLGDRGPAVGARLAARSVAEARDGSLLVAEPEFNRLRRITRAGTIETVAGTGAARPSGDGGPARLAALDAPTGVAVARDGSILVATRLRVRRIATDGTISTVAGNGRRGTVTIGRRAVRTPVFPGQVAVLPMAVS
jgi:hypothetical protein